MIFERSEQEAAFSNYRLWESLGFAIAYGYSDKLCIQTKLYLLISYLSLGMIGYGYLEIKLKIKIEIVPF